MSDTTRIPEQCSGSIKVLKVKNVEFENCRFLIKKFLKPENISYPSQIKIAKQLLKQYPEIEFWELFEIGFFLNSLAFFLTDKGSKLVAEAYSTTK